MEGGQVLRWACLKMVPVFRLEMWPSQDGLGRLEMDERVSRRLMSHLETYLSQAVSGWDPSLTHLKMPTSSSQDAPVLRWELGYVFQIR